MNYPTSADILAAHERIRPFIHNTPVMTSRYLDQLTGANLYFKCENFQRVGAFKFRGACNAVFSLSGESASKGVATHSSGNHAQALALAARIRGIDAHIVMPSDAPRPKKEAVQAYGAHIVFCEPTLQSREETLERVVKETGAIEIHPYNDKRIIAGQATAAIELMNQAGNLDLIITPVGGGGLLSGTLLAAHHFFPNTRVIAVEPELADDAFRSLQAGRILPPCPPVTIADGLRTSLGTLTFPIIQQFVERIITVSDQSILSAMKIIWERMKIVVEPSACVTLAAILEGKLDLKGKKAGMILSGGNVDLDRLPWM